MKLNKNTKEAILNAALVKAGIPEKKLAIRQRYAAWAEAVRVLYVTPEQLTLIEKAREAVNAVDGKLIRNGFRAQHNYAIEHANIGGQRRTVFFCGATEYSNHDRNKKASISPSSDVVTLAAENPLTQQLFDIDHDAEKLKGEIEQLTASLWAVLNSVTTDKKLVEIWPEAIAFIPAAEKAATVNLPALPIAELNKLIGLP